MDETPEVEKGFVDGSDGRRGDANGLERGDCHMGVHVTPDPEALGSEGRRSGNWRAGKTRSSVAKEVEGRKLVTRLFFTRNLIFWPAWVVLIF